MITTIYHAGEAGNHEYGPLDMPQWIKDGINVIQFIIGEERRAKEAELRWRARGT
jgi:hypothetical protein